MRTGLRALGLTMSLLFTITAAGWTAAFDHLPWLELKDTHFIVYFQEDRDNPLAQKILREAEKYYQRIGATIGFTRYSNFWTWENRAKIFLFADQAAFLSETGQPEWSIGYANKDSYAIIGRMIVTYRQEENFIDGLLPHEIGHLILHEYIKDPGRIPCWLDEGIAQLFETGKMEQSLKIMRAFAAQDKFIPFPYLMHWDIRQEQDPVKVTLFYAQSLTIVEFLIKQYGSDAFGRLCRNIRDGKPFEEALRSAYPTTVPTMAALEKKWLSFLQGR